jgi:hypothetical protein
MAISIESSHATFLNELTHLNAHKDHKIAIENLNFHMMELRHRELKVLFQNAH